MTYHRIARALAATAAAAALAACSSPGTPVGTAAEPSAVPSGDVEGIAPGDVDTSGIPLGFVANGATYTCANGATITTDIAETSYPADPEYPDTYPAVARAVRVTVTATNPTRATFDVLPFLFGIQFADVSGSFQALVGNPDADTSNDKPRLMAPNARVEWHESFTPTDGTEWPADARLTAAVRCPGSNPQQEPGNVPNEAGQWTGVPTKR